VPRIVVLRSHARRRHGAARPEQDLVVRLAVVAQRDLAIGAAVDVVESHAGQAALCDATQIADVDSVGGSNRAGHERRVNQTASLREPSSRRASRTSARSAGNALAPRLESQRDSARGTTMKLPPRIAAFVLPLATALAVFAPGAVAQTPARPAATPRPPALRPFVAGPNAGVSAGHPLTTAVAFETLLKGGNAFDAGVAALLTGGVVEQDLYSLGGEALVLVYPKKEGKVTSVVGQGWAPKAVDVDWFLSRGKSLKGEGLDPAVVPGALHAALTVLEKWGTMSFEQVAAPAIAYAKGGFPMRQSTASGIETSTRVLQAVAGQPALLAQARRNDLQAPARRSGCRPSRSTLEAHGRSGATRARRKGRSRRHRGRARSLLQGRPREGDGGVPSETSRHPSCWTTSRRSTPASRSPRKPRTAATPSTSTASRARARCLLQTLNILEGFDLRAMGHDSPDYIHTVTEAMKLAYADRDTYYADTAFVKVPAAGLLSKDYAKARAALIDPKAASTSFIAGDPLKFDSCGEGVAVHANVQPARRRASGPRRPSRIDDFGASRRRTSGRADSTQRASPRTPRTSPSSTRRATCSTRRPPAAGFRAR
jgi:hypothetical protein